MPLWRQVVSERNGYFSPQEWYDALDLGKTLRGAISAREADEIIRKLSFKSFEADYKTMLIWLPEAMNEEAANKILKILEEPWDRTLFILVCEHPDRLLPTIVSRTQEVCVPRIAINSCPASTRRESMLTPVISIFESPVTCTGWIAFSNSFNNISVLLNLILNAT